MKLILSSSMTLLLLSACSLDPRDKSTIHVDLSGIAKESNSQLESNLSTDEEIDVWKPDNQISYLSGPSILAFPPSPMPRVPAAPGNLAIGSTDFTCFILNVMGPGIVDNNDHDPSDEPPQTRYSRAVNGGYTAYAGITSAPITATGNQTVEISVPAGPGRLVQVLGLKRGAANDAVDQFCNNQTSLLPNGDGFFEVARAFIPSAYGDLAVNMNAHYLTSHPVWYKEFKRITGGISQAGCREYDGKFCNSTASCGVQVPITGTDRTHFAITLNPGASVNQISVNRFKVELEGGAASSVVTAKLYVDGFLGGVVNPTGATQVVNSADTYTLGAGAPGTSFVFNFPPTNFPASTNTVLVIEGTTPFNMMGNTGSYSGQPLTGAYEWTGSWTTCGATLPFVTVERCY